MRHGPIAWWLLDELRDEEHRERQFSASQDTLSELAAERPRPGLTAQPVERRNSIPTSREVARNATFLGGVCELPSETRGLAQKGVSAVPREPQAPEPPLQRFTIATASGPPA